jgi:hypothetical protein
VVGSNNAQNFTVTGSSFVSGAKVQAAYSSSGYVWADTTVNATFVNSTTLTVPITTQTTPDTWRVRVRNPDNQTSSNYATFTVTAQATFAPPTVQTVTANPVTSTSAVINGTITSNGGAAIDDRRFDWGTSQPLSNPVYAQSITVSGNNFSATLAGLSPNTTYYFRAWAHNGSTTNAGYGVGWNTGAVLSFVTSPAAGSGLPIITLQPADMTIPTNGTSTLTVIATGSNLTYQWFRDGTPILGARSLSLSVSLPASYWVVLSNAGGSVSSRHASVTSGTPNPAPPASQPAPGQATWMGRIDPTLPTFVITHGWQPFEIYNQAPPEWVTKMGLEIFNRLEKSNYPPRINGQRANIIFFTWPEAYTFTLFPFSEVDLTFINGYTALLYASSYTHSQGARLNSELQRLLGPSYSGDLHFIGHSLGTIVNSYAIERFPHSGMTQFTVLDAPLKFTLYSPLFFAEHLGSANVDWVDNYIATNALPLPPGVGDNIGGAAPSGGRRVPTNHTGIHDQYLGTITDDTTREGFYNSEILGPAGGFPTRPAPQIWRASFSADDVDLILDLGAHLPEITSEGFRLLQGGVRQAADTVRGAVRESIHLLTNFFGGSNSILDERARTSAADALVAGLAAGDAAISIDVVVPTDANSLTFDYRFPGVAPGDWLAVTFNNVLLYSFPADLGAQADFVKAEIPIGSIAGKAGIMIVAVHSTSATQTEVALSNFQFSTIKSSQNPAPVTPSVPIANGAIIGLVASVNGLYVTAESAGSSSLIANRPGLGAWEEFQIIDLGDGTIALRSLINGQFVCADNGGNSALIANRSAIGQWEKFQLEDAGNGNFAIIAKANGKYVCAENAGKSQLIANRTAVGGWEQFRMVFMPSVKPVIVTASFQSGSTGSYLCADGAGAGWLVANRAAEGAWEQFQLIDAGNGNVAVRSLINGLYVTAENAGTAPLIANRNTSGVWEQFELLDVGGGYVALRALANGRYVSAGNAGDQLIANRSYVGRTEQFALNVSLRAVANNAFVCAENSGKDPLIANRASIGGWEQFQVVNTSSGYFGLKAKANGLFVCAENNGNAPLIANRPGIGLWEQFQWISAGNGNTALKAAVNGMFVCAESGGQSALIANRPSASTWEQFR